MTLSRLVRLARICISLGVLCLAGAAQVRAGDATVIYKKIFPGSSPEFVEIRVGQSEGATWDIRQLNDPADPEPLEIRPALRARIFEIAGAMNDFEGQQLDVHRRLANLGQKTFRYESGGVVHETTFNYTTDQNANQLLDIFEGLSRQQQDLQAIRHSMKYDRLGINDALIQFENDLDHRSLPEPDCLLPALDQLAADSRFLNMARERARSLAQRIRAAENLPLNPPSSQNQQAPLTPANAQNR